MLTHQPVWLLTLAAALVSIGLAHGAGLKPAQPTTEESGSGDTKPGDPLQSYLEDMRRHKLLSKEDQREVGRAAFGGDQEAALKLFHANLQLVVKRANELCPVGVPVIQLLDLIQEGNIALLSLAPRWNPDGAAKTFPAYVKRRLRGSMLDYIRKNWGNGKIATTPAHRKVFFSLKGERAKLVSRGKLEQADPIPVPEAERIAAALSNDKIPITSQDVLDVDKALLKPVELDAPKYAQDDSDSVGARRVFAGDNQLEDVRTAQLAAIFEREFLRLDGQMDTKICVAKHKGEKAQERLERLRRDRQSFMHRLLPHFVETGLPTAPVLAAGYDETNPTQLETSQASKITESRVCQIESGLATTPITELLEQPEAVHADVRTAQFGDIFERVFFRLIGQMDTNISVAQHQGKTAKERLVRRRRDRQILLQRLLPRFVEIGLPTARVLDYAGYNETNPTQPKLCQAYGITKSRVCQIERGLAITLITELLEQPDAVHKDVRTAQFGAMLQPVFLGLVDQLDTNISAAQSEVKKTQKSLARRQRDRQILRQRLPPRLVETGLLTARVLECAGYNKTNHTQLELSEASKITDSRVCQIERNLTLTLITRLLEQPKAVHFVEALQRHMSATPHDPRGLQRDLLLKIQSIAGRKPPGSAVGGNGGSMAAPRRRDHGRRTKGR